jgi:hypothetical protein
LTGRPAGHFNDAAPELLSTKRSGDERRSMSLSNVLNVAVGLVCTFLFLGLLGTTVYEVGASLCRARGRLLRTGMQTLLSNGVAGGPLFGKVFGHSLVQSLSARGLPSYVPANSFATALFDALSDAGPGGRFAQIERSIQALPEGPTKQSLRAFIVEAGGDFDALRSRVEAWFNDAMDRLSGVYKRRSQAIHLLFGLAVAIGFNIDSIHIAEVLWQNPGKQEAMVSIVQNYTAANQSLPATISTDRAMQQLVQLPVPMGWEGFRPPRSPALWLYPLVGWLVTGFSVSLGAPFWFDLLQKLMDINVRGTGPKPDQV